MSDETTTREKLRKAEIDISGRNRHLVNHAAVQLNEIICDFPESNLAREARRLLQRYGHAETSKEVATPPLTANEMKIIETIDSAASWDIPALTGIGSFIPNVPTQTFPTQLANSLRRLLDQVEPIPARNAQNMRRFYYVVIAISKRQRYEDLLKPLVDRMGKCVNGTTGANSANE